MQEKHRIFARFYPTFFSGNDEALRLLLEAAKHPEDPVLALELYGNEILQYDETYPDGGTAALTYLLRNEGNFFIQGLTTQAVRAVSLLFGNACKTTSGIDQLAFVKESLVKYTLAGRNRKLLKTQSKYYNSQQLQLIDAGFLMIF